MIDKKDEYQPRFGLYHAVVNQQIPAIYSKLNEWHFEHFFKICFLKFGFFSMIRDVNENSIFLKVYYLSNKISINEHHIDEFLSAFYLYEHPGLYYNQCNILKIPINHKIDVFAIENTSNIKELESLLQLHLKEDSWVGIDFSGTKGSYTNLKPVRNKNIYNGWKKVLFDNQIEKWKEDKSKSTLPQTPLQPEHNNLEINSDLNSFKLSWKPQLGVESNYTIKFKWKGVLFKLNAIGNYELRYTTVVACVEYFNHKYRFGFGRAHIGAGAIGKCPEIKIGNHELKFHFGKNHIQVLEEVIQRRFVFRPKKKQNCFCIII